MINRLNLPFAEVTHLGCRGRYLITGAARTARKLSHFQHLRGRWVFVLFNCTLIGEGVAELLIEMQRLWLRCFTSPSPLQNLGSQRDLPRVTTHPFASPSIASPSIASLVSSGVWSPAAKAIQSHRHPGKGRQKVGDEFGVSFICNLSFLGAAKRSGIQLYKQRV